ncbi:MAG TPA: hypothetical protein VI318_23950 [Baekduia sp.]
MPTFCRHNRLVENCPICSKKERVKAPTRSVARRPSKPEGSGTARAPRKSVSSGMTVRRVQRAPDDGYEHDVVPGLRSSIDAGRLADELAFSVARLRELSEAPPGLYADVTREADREEAAWLAFLITYFGPLDGDDPWKTIRERRTSWASGEDPALDGAEFGRRNGHDPRRGAEVFAAYRAWASRGGGQITALAGEESWTLQHRYDRAFERLGLPGFGRPARVELLVVEHRLGLVDLDPWTMHLSSASPMDPVALAAKRVLGIGDPVLLQRRQRELANGVGVPVETLDLAFYNWSQPVDDERYVAGSGAVVDQAERDGIATALGL